jgi:hypothetical protein
METGGGTQGGIGTGIGTEIEIGIAIGTGIGTTDIAIATDTTGPTAPTAAVTRQRAVGAGASG